MHPILWQHLVRSSSKHVLAFFAREENGITVKHGRLSAASGCDMNCRCEVAQRLAMRSTRPGVDMGQPTPTAHDVSGAAATCLLPREVPKERVVVC